MRKAKIHSGLHILSFAVLCLLFCDLESRAEGAPLRSPDRIIIGIKSSEGERDVESRILKLTAGRIIRRHSSINSIYVATPTRLNDQDFGSLIVALEKIPGVSYAEPDYYLRAFEEPTRIPNDTYFGDQWGMHVKDAPNSGDADLPEAWAITTGSKVVTTAVIDSGIDYHHRDLAANIWNNVGEVGKDSRGKDKRTNGIDDDNNGFIDDWRGWDFVNNDNDPFDDDGHGTHCAGTIGAAGDNRFGIAGVNWQGSLMALKFLDSTGSGTTEDAIRALEYSVKMGARVSNNSYGGDEYSKAFLDIIAWAGQHGMLFVAAAGNSSTNIDEEPLYPASFEDPAIITVGASDRSDQLADFSCYGPKSVDLIAPGDEIMSTIPGNKFYKKSGTSMAAPFVAGVAALVLSKYPALSVGELKARLIKSVVKTEAYVGSSVSEGRLNARDALAIE